MGPSVHADGDGEGDNPLLSIASVSKSNALSPNWQLCEPAHPACRNWGDQNQFFVPRVGNWLEVFAAK